MSIFGGAILSNDPLQAMQQRLRFLNIDRLIRFVWLPIPLLLVATAVLWAANLRTVYASQLLLISLNFFCTTLASVLVAVLVGRSFLVSGELGLLMMGCGVICWGVAVTVGSAVALGINAVITIHNILAFLAAFCHLMGIVFSRKRYRAMRLAGLILAIAYAGTLCVVCLVVVLTTHDLTPLFFVQNQGGTSIRQFVLGATIVMFGITGAVLWWTNRSSLSMFVQWYGAALLLVATGLLGVMVQPVFGGVLSWTGRITQSLGGIYLLMAAIASLRESGLGGLSLSAALREIQQNYRTLVEMSPDAIVVHAGGKYVFVNPAAVHLFGAIGSEDLVGRDVLSLVHPEDREPVAARLRLVVQESRVALGRYFRVLRLDGQPVDVEMTGARIEFQGRTAVQLVLRDITERKHIEECLSSTLAEKEVLLREVHHRVKNNLQIISSLISLQVDSLADERLQGVLSDVRGRIITMSLVHEKLYQTEGLAKLSFDEYAGSLLQYIWRSHGVAEDNVRLNMSFAPLLLPVEKAVHCGLILNELASNAIKHAFPNGSGCEVSVTLDHDPATGAACLRVRDNGIGLPADLDWRKSGSLGLRLVQMLAGQMRGTVQTGPGSDLGPGTEFQLNFNV
ncbi:MAG: histidine kinase dimerization/phosphoacceptor domain -containing protein [Pseudomonadota bacterium]